MTGGLEQTIREHRASGVLLDANLLLLLVVGLTHREEVDRFRRTSNSFTVEDFDLLESMLEGFEQLWTTPHVLAETSNFLGHAHNNLRDSARTVLSLLIEKKLLEVVKPAAELVKQIGFHQLGLTDVGVLAAAREHRLILTTDMPLTQAAATQGLAAINFNHLRDWGM